MYLCYIDESGTSSPNDSTSHFVLAGLAIPIWKWKTCEKDIQRIKQNFQLEKAEIHTGQIMRPYLEQSKIRDFDSLSDADRIAVISKYRRARK